MTVKILKSAVAAAGIADFGAAVEIFAKDLTAWHAHDALAKQGQAQAYPAPTAHPLVRTAVRADDAGAVVADFELVEALPVRPNNPAALRARKDELSNEVFRAENAAIEIVAPAGRRRAHGFRHKDAVEADAKRRVAISEEINDSAEMATAIKKPGAAGVAAVAALRSRIEARTIAERSPEHAEIISRHQDIMNRCEVIARHAAEQLDRIEDLTADNAHLWKMSPFPN